MKTIIKYECQQPTVPLESRTKWTHAHTTGRNTQSIPLNNEPGSPGISTPSTTPEESLMRGSRGSYLILIYGQSGNPPELRRARGPSSILVQIL